MRLNICKDKRKIFWKFHKELKSKLVIKNIYVKKLQGILCRNNQGDTNELGYYNCYNRLFV